MEKEMMHILKFGQSVDTNVPNRVPQITQNVTPKQNNKKPSIDETVLFLHFVVKMCYENNKPE
jgi:hypothetical protein